MLLGLLFQVSLLSLSFPRFQVFIFDRLLQHTPQKNFFAINLVFNWTQIFSFFFEHVIFQSIRNDYLESNFFINIFLFLSLFPPVIFPSLSFHWFQIYPDKLNNNRHGHVLACNFHFHNWLSLLIYSQPNIDTLSSTFAHNFHIIFAAVFFLKRLHSNIS